MSFFLDKNTYVRNDRLSLKEKLVNMSWSFLFIILAVVSIGLLVLYSIKTNGTNQWVQKQAIWFCLGLGLFVCIAFTQLKFWMRYAYFIYGASLIMLFLVPLIGTANKGAKRWIDIGLFQIQPSEAMKIALVLALARYFHTSDSKNVKKTTHLIIPLLLMIVPVGLILNQPDLGTAMMLLLMTVGVFWVVGVQWWKFVVVGLSGLAMIPVAWHFLHDYQKNRVMTFLHPESDPLGRGYHILQSKITLGSGGVFGKGFGQGTQNLLGFIPEKHTDFIFTILAEEFGLIGCSLLLFLYLLIIFYGFYMSLRCVSFFGKVLGIGLTINFALYVFINISMVMGLMPVVGIPLPLVSYGGTAMLVLMMGFGFVECVHINDEMEISHSSDDD